MKVETWLGTFNETTDALGFRNAEARALSQFMERYGAPVGSFVEGRRRDDQELVVLDLHTGAPQRPFYPIRPSERVGIFFRGDQEQPLVTMLRDDFPDTEHQQLVPERFPATICIDDRPWSEARLTWTPSELIERILSWFRRAGRGELHDARQPLDPIFMGSPLKFFIERSVLDAGPAQDLIAEHDPADGSILWVLPAVSGRRASGERFCIVTYKVNPARMKRLAHVPEDLAGLAALLDQRCIKLFDDLKQRLGGWLAEGASAAWRLNGRFAVIVEMPVVSPRGVQQDGFDHRIFVTAVTAGDVAIALGIAEKSPAGLGMVGYAKVIGATAPNEAAIAAVSVQSAEVHLAFEPDLAARLAGKTLTDSRRAVMVGAGAIGSHLADNLVREGRFQWTIIDDDRLLPHNLARHIAQGASVKQPKARILADHVNAVLAGPPRATAIAANLLTQGEQSAAINSALTGAEIIIDTTASVVAARYLSDHPAEARRVSTFFNPSGEAAVLLAEPADRALSLRDLEAQYLGLVLRAERLGEHLGAEPVTIAYTGACRAITNRIPQARAAILSGVAAAGLGKAVDADDAVISVWTISPDGGVAVDAAAPEPVTRFRAKGWEIALDAGLIQRINLMRDAKVPAETGGILFGVVDILAKRIHLVHASAAPPDSVEQRTSFVRGIKGVDEFMDSVRRRTAGHVRYVGEWHSHPPRSSARPSAVDGKQIDWLAALMGMDSMPALMVIAAERELAVIFADQKATPLPEDGTDVGA